ncbi:MAG: metalloregulator ArsR/SmtB family transcription factor, partial [Thermomicrobiales bacterium]
MTTITLQPKTSAPRASFATLAKLLKVLGDPTRLALVALLARREHCVCDLMTALNLPQSTCSHHLGVLKRAGLVQDRRDDHDARWAYYTLNPATTALLQGQLAAMLDLSNFDPTPARCD